MYKNIKLQKTENSQNHKLILHAKAQIVNGPTQSPTKRPIPNVGRVHSDNNLEEVL